MKKLEKIVAGGIAIIAIGTATYFLSKVPPIKNYFDGSSYIIIYHIDVSPDEPESRPDSRNYGR